MIIRHHPEMPLWLCVGDVADDQGRYQDWDAPVHWIKGNNENLDVIASGDLPAGLLSLPNGVARRYTVCDAGLDGTFAPSLYGTAAGDLPHPRTGARGEGRTGR